MGWAVKIFLIQLLILSVVVSVFFYRNYKHYDIVLFGDSITSAYNKNDLGISSIKNMGKSGDTVKGGLERYKSVMKHTPKIVVVQLGINDIISKGYTANQCIELYDELILKLKNDGVKIVLNSLYSRNVEPNLTIIPQVNEHIKNYAGVVFVDTTFIMEDRNLYTTDGLHPNGAGYARITPLWKDAIDKLAK